MIKFKKHFPEYYGSDDIKEYESLKDLFKSIGLQENYSWKYQEGNPQTLVQERNDHAVIWIVGHVYNYDLSKDLEKI